MFGAVGELVPNELSANIRFFYIAVALGLCLTGIALLSWRKRRLVRSGVSVQLLSRLPLGGGGRGLGGEG